MGCRKLDRRGATPQALGMWRYLYQGLLLVAWPWVLLRLRWRARREPAYGQRVGERFGRVPGSVPRGVVWFHTVSAGETIAAAPIIDTLVERFPELPFLVTTMTPTGSAQVSARLGARVHHCYAPYDFPWAVRRFYRALAPRLLVLMETELWPNLVRAAAARDIPVVLVNARLSERSARGYRRLGGLTRSMLQSLDHIACQYPDHAGRFVALGAAAAKVSVLGSVKFDAALPEDFTPRVEALRQRYGLAGDAVWIAASTHPGEEAAALDAHRHLVDGGRRVRLVLVPRHPARTDEVLTLIRSRGFSVARQSGIAGGDGDADVILGDTMGELMYLYGLAEVAFVGGSLAPLGGHNPIEPALCGVPVIMGPAVFNFPDVVAVFRDAGCLCQVDDADSLSGQLGQWLGDRPVWRDRGARARDLVARHTGASDRLVRLLESRIQGAGAAPGLSGRHG